MGVPLVWSYGGGGYVRSYKIRWCQSEIVLGYSINRRPLKRPQYTVILVITTGTLEMRQTRVKTSEIRVVKDHHHLPFWALLTGG